MLMLFRRFSVLLVFVVLVVVSAHIAGARTRPAPEQFQQFGGCVLAADALNDGDSFLVQLSDGRRATFRLYFVDAAEEHLSGRRSTRQARYFRIKPGRAGAIGRDATAFTARALTEPFTVFTRWQSNFDEGRYLAFVGTAERRDLAELLVRNGLAILHGERTHTPYGRSSSSQFRRLKELERLAQADQIGGWGQQ